MKHVMTSLSGAHHDRLNADARMARRARRAGRFGLNLNPALDLQDAAEGVMIALRIDHLSEGTMGHPTLSFEEVRQRNEEIVAYANQHPEVTNTALGVKYDLSRETIRLILDRDRRRTERNKRLEAKAHHWGLRGH
jgi:hypothetical protein